MPQILGVIFFFLMYSDLRAMSMNSDPNSAQHSALQSVGRVHITRAVALCHARWAHDRALSVSCRTQWACACRDTAHRPGPVVTPSSPNHFATPKLCRDTKQAKLCRNIKNYVATPKRPNRVATSKAMSRHQLSKPCHDTKNCVVTQLLPAVKLSCRDTKAMS